MLSPLAPSLGHKSSIRTCGEWTGDRGAGRAASGCLTMHTLVSDVGARSGPVRGRNIQCVTHLYLCLDHHWLSHSVSSVFISLNLALRLPLITLIHLDIRLMQETHSPVPIFHVFAELMVPFEIHYVNLCAHFLIT